MQLKVFPKNWVNKIAVKGANTISPFPTGTVHVYVSPRTNYWTPK